MKIFKYRKMSRGTFILAILLLMGVGFYSSIVMAGEHPIINIADDILTFVTTDTTATSSVTWGTVGFSITTKKTGGDVDSKKCATIWFTNGSKKEDSDSTTGFTTVTFKTNKDALSTALVKAGYGNIKEGQIIYVHTIFQVYHNGKPYGGVIYSLSGIKNAEGWKNPDDFTDHFDVPVPYGSGPKPVAIEYRTQSGAIIEEFTRKESNWVVPGDTVSYTLDTEKSYNGISYKLYRSEINYLATNKRIVGTYKSLYSANKDSLSEVQNRSYDQPVGGSKLVAYMKPVLGKSTDGVELVAPNAHGVIAADLRDNEQFDVVEGIPTTENLYVNVVSDNYLMGYQLTRVTYLKQYPVTVSKKYTLNWTETDPVTKKSVAKSDSQTIEKTITVERPYSYSYISNLDVFALSSSKLNNYALPGGSASILPTGYTAPKIDYKNSTVLEDHIKNLVYDSTITLPGETITDSDAKPSIPDENGIFQSVAEGEVGQIMVKNDSLIFNGTTILSDEYKEAAAPVPVEYEVEIEEIGEDVLYKSGLTIEATKANGSYNTSGTVTYNRIAQVNSKYSATLSYNVTELTNVVIHTPTVCDAYISNQSSYNQMINPDKSRDSLVLDTTFSVMLPTSGSHRYIDGYGYLDYAKYIESRQVQFPFDVYQGSQYIPAGTWISLSSDITSFYLPIWITEGNYTISFRSISINATANNAVNWTESLANLSLSNYVATDTINVQVSGRIYGLNLYDISDYPLWKTVFRKNNSLKTTGFTYTVGTQDQNGASTGRNDQFTLALLNGSHPSVNDTGALKAGYITRFNLKTIGNMYQDTDYIWIRPTFYYVDSQGGNRQEVDLYYTETFQGKKQVLVKAGSLLDRQNIKISYLGDTYRSVPIPELLTKARITGKSLSNVMDTNNNLYTFTNMLIPETLRTYVGENYTPTGTVPNGINPDLVTKSVQKWYGEYYLPGEIHLAPKGFDVMSYAKEKGGIDYQESFWLKEGFLIVNFNIETIQNGTRHLSYQNLENAANGYCNMWKMEGFQYQKKDDQGNLFDFLDGDMYLMHTKKSASIDYRAGGTH